MTRPSRRRAPARLLLAALALAAAGGCTSAAGRLDQGLRLEEQGRPADAARRYADALRRDPSLAEARARLQQTGDLAVRGMLDEAARAPDADQAADAYLEADELRRVSSAVGVTLAVPPDYPAARRAALDRAIAGALAAAEDEVRSGEFDATVARLTRASRWEPSAAQREALDGRRHDAHLAWAELSLRSGTFRDAHRHAAEAAAVFGTGSGRAARALELQAEALRRGTVRVAVLPPAASVYLRRRLPGDLVQELADELATERWRTPPLFVQVTEAQAAAREARRRGVLREVASQADARAVGGALGADVVVTLVLDSIAESERDVQRSRVAVRTRAGADTAYTLLTGRREVRARLTYTLVDAGAGRSAPVETGTVWAEVGTRLRRGEYRGDPGELALPARGDAELFTAAAAWSEATTRSLADELGARVERAVLDAVARRVR